LIRTPRTLPRVLSLLEADAFVAALRTRRDRAMLEAMLLGGLRRCEVLGLGMGDVSAGDRRLFIAEGPDPPVLRESLKGANCLRST
jgi:integrase/recombinase XerD